MKGLVGAGGKSTFQDRFGSVFTESEMTLEWLECLTPDLCYNVVLALLLMAILLLCQAPAFAATIKGSRHDLSTSGSPEVCVFCHTPHNANPDSGPPLWNRAVKADQFTMYSSDTLNSVLPANPSPVSLLCLGCHDGTISKIVVNGVLVDNKHDLINYHGSPDTQSDPRCERCHSDIYGGGPPNLSLGTDLGDDHPISMDYPSQSVDPGFNTPPNANGWGAGNVRLVGGKVECASCHDVHDPAIVPFLRLANNNSQLCLTCHNK